MIFKDKSFLRFAIIFLSIFFLCYYGALFFTGLAVPGGRYSPWIDKHFDIAASLRNALIFSTKWLVSLFGLASQRTSEYVLRVPESNGIKIVYSCLGFGVMSFWTAYICATQSTITKKLVWLFGGLLFIYAINVLRISLVLLAGNRHWKFPFGWDHHTWFNIVAYISIFCMMYFFEKKIKINPVSGS